MPDNDKDKPKEIRFTFEKARHHRTFHADGAWASVTPRGEVQISFFNDLRPMPQFTVHQLDDAGALGKEVARELRPLDVTRELNVTVIMDIEILDQVIALVQSIQRRIRQEAESKKSEPQPK